MPCRTMFEDWVEYVDGRLTPGRQTELDAHLATGCADCEATVAWLNRILPRMRSAGMTPMPAPLLLERAGRIFPDAFPMPTFRERLRAVLRFDSLQAALPAGARSAPSSERQLLYQAGDIDIDLHFHPATGLAYNLTGQIMPGPERLAQVEGARIGLHMADRTVLEGAADDLGEFSLAGFGPGRYHLTIALTDCDILVDNLELS